MAKKKRKLWIVNLANEDDSHDFCGIFKSRKKAEKVAKSIDKYCWVVSCKVGSMKWATIEKLGHGDAYYPHFEKYKG